MAGIKAPCGTYAGYVRHCKYREPMDEACRLAGKEYLAARYKKRMEENPEGIRKNSRESARRRRERDPEKEKTRIRHDRLGRVYGITHSQWIEMFTFQNDQCRCCETTVTGQYHWATDHNHLTGNLRGITCHPCNNLLGRCEDDANGVVRTTLRFLHYLADSGNYPDAEHTEAILCELKKYEERRKVLETI